VSEVSDSGIINTGGASFESIPLNQFTKGLFIPPFAKAATALCKLVVHH